MISGLTSAYILFDDQTFPIRQTNRNDNCHTKRNNLPAIDYSKAGGDPDVQLLLWSVLQSYLYKEMRPPLLLAIDEAQYLNAGILNDIKMLMNYGYNSVNYFTLILCGETYLNDALRKPTHEALRQRITVHYNYAGLSDDEVSKYLLHKIQLAGATSTIIDPAALAAVHSFTQGNRV